MRLQNHGGVQKVYSGKINQLDLSAVDKVQTHNTCYGSLVEVGCDETQNHGDMQKVYSGKIYQLD